ncbi:MAG: efflux RND transporter periplasmic adaptor subunit [Saprospiraceae bacterium]|nr:efflux RND transporter periplasmic adaptor subunit [Saprospiraceae bacterium]
MDFSVPEKYAANINKGSKISFGLDGSAQKFDGMVTAIDPKIDEALRTLKIRATVPNAVERFQAWYVCKSKRKAGLHPIHSGAQGDSDTFYWGQKDLCNEGR